MTSKEVSTFEKLLFADTFRGPHSTGVFCRREVYAQNEKHITIPLYKEAVTGPDYLDTFGWSVLNQGYDVTTNLADFYVGHNRWATQGAINDKNAHPFKHGDITLVHNGTLLDQKLLPDSENFEVDSENICHSINKIGAAETIQKLDGAFALIWHDRKDDTLHIIRNDERPFHLLETTSGDWFGASEEDMLMWIIGRNKVPYVVKQHFECKVGVEYIFDVKDTFKLIKEIKHELPDFYYGGSGWGMGNGYGGQGWYDKYYGAHANKNSNVTPISQYKPNDPHAAVAMLLSEEGLNKKYGDYINITPYNYIPYNGNQGKGKVEGCVDGHAVYIEVVAHGVEINMYDEFKLLNGRITGAYHKSGVTTIVVTDVAGKSEDKEVEPEKGEPFLEDKRNKKSVNGRTFTQTDWDNSGRNICGICDDRIPFEEADDTEIFCGSSVCGDCVSAGVPKMLGEGMQDYDPADEDIKATFCCRQCGISTPLEEESEKAESICEDCVEWYEDLYPGTKIH